MMPIVLKDAITDDRVKCPFCRYYSVKSYSDNPSWLKVSIGKHLAEQHSDVMFNILKQQYELQTIIEDVIDDPERRRILMESQGPEYV